MIEDERGMQYVECARKRCPAFQDSGLCTAVECTKRIPPKSEQPATVPVDSPSTGSISVGLGRIDKIGADRLAYECARQVIANNINSRSGIGDALLDYLRIGQPGQPDSVPEWMDQYEKSNDRCEPCETKE